MVSLCFEILQTLQHSHVTECQRERQSSKAQNELKKPSSSHKQNLQHPRETEAPKPTHSSSDTSSVNLCTGKDNLLESSAGCDMNVRPLQMDVKMTDKIETKLVVDAHDAPNDVVTSAESVSVHEEPAGTKMDVEECLVTAESGYDAGLGTSVGSGSGVDAGVGVSSESGLDPSARNSIASGSGAGAEPGSGSGVGFTDSQDSEGEEEFDDSTNNLKKASATEEPSDNIPPAESDSAKNEGTQELPMPDGLINILNESWQYLVGLDIHSIFLHPVSIHHHNHYHNHMILLL